MTTANQIAIWLQEFIKHTEFNMTQDILSRVRYCVDCPFLDSENPCPLLEDNRSPLTVEMMYAETGLKPQTIYNKFCKGELEYPLRKRHNRIIFLKCQVIYVDLYLKRK